jgi:uncharacterized protein
MSFSSLVFTPLLKKLQERYGSRRQYERMENSGGSQGRFTPFEIQFPAPIERVFLIHVEAYDWNCLQQSRHAIRRNLPSDTSGPLSHSS